MTNKPLILAEFIRKETERMCFPGKYDIFTKERSMELIYQFNPYISHAVIPDASCFYTKELSVRAALFAVSSGFDVLKSHDDCNMDLIDGIICSCLAYYSLHLLKHRLLASGDFIPGSIITPGCAIPLERSASIFSRLKPDPDRLRLTSHFVMIPKYSLNGLILEDGRATDECGICGMENCAYKNITTRIDSFLKSAE